MAGVGEVIASAVVKQITTRLFQLLKDEITLQWKFKGEVVKMAEEMKFLAAVMHDADDRVHRGGRVGEEVALWLRELKSVSFDLEDLLDDLEPKNNEAKHKVFFSRDNQVYQWITRPRNLEEVRKRIEKIKNKGMAFNLQHEAEIVQRQPETYAPSSVERTPTGMQGRTKEKEILIKLILRSEANERISIIPIVGLGGIGKTTLAQSIWADNRVRIFDIQAWVHVSDKFDLLKIARTIIRSVDRDINLADSSLHLLKNTVEVKLTGKKYLIVLDDFWEEDIDKIEALKDMLKYGSQGSRIIVTTRNQRVVEVMTTGFLASQRVILPVLQPDQISLGSLKTSHCWELIKVRAFGPYDVPTDLEEIGKEIASKCGGIPLVANAFGTVMSENKSTMAWKNIKMRLANLVWRSDQQQGTLESLQLSYSFMKLDFKICFAYLGVFPKGFIIDTNRLIQQWKALEYIYSEFDGESCIKYLLDMSFLQISGHPPATQSPVNANTSQQLTMHDLVHDLASIITRGEFLVLDAGDTKSGTWKKDIHCRHAEQKQYKNQPNVFKNLPKKIRSLHVRDSQTWLLPPKAFSGSKYVRVLDLTCPVGQLFDGQSTSRLPSSIKKMRLLRYLDITRLPVSSLSDSVHILQNMETLIMSNCSLKTFPDNFCRLQNLFYLDLSGNKCLNKLPTSLGKLSRLSFLSLSGCSLLQDLPDSICNLTCLQHLDMSECLSIQNLAYKFGTLPNLLFLSLAGCSKLSKLPESVSLESLKHLNLSSCHELESLPDDFGKLQNLLFLSLSECYKLSLLPDTFCHLFHLKTLDLSDCHDLSELPNCFGNLSELDSLNLTSCSKLQVLPESFGKLLKLRRLNLSYCMRLESLPTSLLCLKLELLDIFGSHFHELPDFFNDYTTHRRLVTSGKVKVLHMDHASKEFLNLPGMMVHNVQPTENNGGSSIVELEDLSCPELKVLQLENVSHPEEAERANLRDKSDLRVLHLGWGLQGEEGKSMLERLIPPRTLEQFFLQGYMSKDFPNWMSHFSSHLPSLVDLNLCDLGKCESLPPFGQLPNLRSLLLENIPNLRKISMEFYGGGGGTCMKLRVIQLRLLENLVEWRTTQSGEENKEFLIPNLHSLSIRDCPKLKFLPYPPRSIFLLLENSNIVLREEGFGKLSSSTLPFQMVIKNCNFALGKWDRIQHLPTLEILEVYSYSNLRVLPKVIGHLTSLRRLCLWSLKDLEILPEWLGNITSLEDINISNCPMVTSLPESMKYLTALKKLCLKSLKDLEILPEWFGNITSLEDITIMGCPMVTSVPESMKYLTSLKKLSLSSVKDLEILGNITSLENITINDCPLTSLPENMKYLSALKRLFLWHCKGISILPEWLGQLNSLKLFRISDCPNLTSLPKSIQNLTALKYLSIEASPSLVERCQKEDVDLISHIRKVSLER